MESKSFTPYLCTISKNDSFKKGLWFAAVLECTNIQQGDYLLPYSTNGPLYRVTLDHFLLSLWISSNIIYNHHVLFNIEIWYLI